MRYLKKLKAYPKGKIVIEKRVHGRIVHRSFIPLKPLKAEKVTYGLLGKYDLTFSKGIASRWHKEHHKQIYRLPNGMYAMKKR